MQTSIQIQLEEKLYFCLNSIYAQKWIYEKSCNFYSNIWIYINCK